MQSPSDFEQLLGTKERLPIKFASQSDQESVTIYKGVDRMYYYVICRMDKDDYFDRNEIQFYSSEPILPKEHLRMQQLMNRDKYQLCSYCIRFVGNEDFIEVITVDRDPLLFIHLSKSLK